MTATIAVATDGSETAGKAVEMARDLARSFEAKLVLLSAYPKAKASPGKSSSDPELQWATNSAARTREILTRLEEDLVQSGVKCETRTGEGDPAEVLLALATECGADLLVVGNKGMKRRVLGSVPNAITHKADCSVLVVKTT